MERPTRPDLPFFAYGLFRPGQLAFFQLRALTSRVEPAHIAGSLLLRDGLPILDLNPLGQVNGALLSFFPLRAAEAYDRILAIDPGKHYCWHECEVDGKSANVLVGRHPAKGSVPCDEEWNGWMDPLFTAALDVVEETHKSQKFDWDLRPLFRLQMAYLLLWSSIERYVSLRYHLGEKATLKVQKLAQESAFAQSLMRHVKSSRKVHRADRPNDDEELDPKSPTKAISYYYQVRSNITHRGKGVVQDYELLEKSLEELLPIFREVLKAAEDDSHFSV